MSKIPFHYYLADKAMGILGQGDQRRGYQDAVVDGVIQQVQAKDATFQANQEIFISSSDVYVDLTLAAIKLVIRIQMELQMNNLFWECPDHSTSQMRGALAQLKKKGIIERIPDTDLFYVNPLKIRKGRPLSCIGAMYMYAKQQYARNKNWKPSSSDIRRLAAPKTLPVIELDVESALLPKYPSTTGK